MAQGAAHTATESAAQLASGVAENVQEQSARVANAYRENPLVIGVVAVAAGLAAGFMIPSTQVEGNLVGETRDELLDKAKELVHEKKEQVEHVAQRVMRDVESTVSDAARSEGLVG